MKMLQLFCDFMIACIDFEHPPPPNTLEVMYRCPTIVAELILNDSGEETFLERLHDERRCRSVGTSAVMRKVRQNVFIVEDGEDTLFIIHTPLVGGGVEA